MASKGFIYKDGKAFEVDRPWIVEGNPKIYGSKEDALSNGRLDDTLRNMQILPSANYDKGWKPQQKKKEEESSGCFLTTACFNCLSIDKEEAELHKLRNFRDNYLSKSSKGLESIQDYYKWAPQIVENINAAKNSSEIYSFLFKEMIKPAIDMIDSDQFENAKQIYLKGFQIIKNSYL